MIIEKRPNGLKTQVVMGKADETRARIISTAALLFNQRGYNGTSIDDIMQATNLKKGGIYNHFSSKEEIALAAFDHSYALQSASYDEILRSVRGQPLLQLHALIDEFIELYQNPVIAGGCVIMNTAIESDDSEPQLALKRRAAAAMDEWRSLIERIILKGINKSVFRPETDALQLTSVIIAALEGGLMMSKLYGDAVFIHSVITHLHTHIDQHVLVPTVEPRLP
jgi:TetR/AcrR family transcriptional regulator, transcriptional repressor for nem operon